MDELVALPVSPSSSRLFPRCFSSFFPSLETNEGSWASQKFDLGKRNRLKLKTMTSGAKRPIVKSLAYGLVVITIINNDRWLILGIN